MNQLDEKAIFLMALELAPPDRAAFLRGACPETAALARVEALLANVTMAHDSDESDSRKSWDDLPCENIGVFRLICELGAGGMGVVYLARDTSLGRDVALKVLSPALVGSERALSRFQTEARSAANLKHPAIVPVYEFKHDGARHYIVSEYVDGPTLAALISEEGVRRGAERKTGGTREWHRRCAEMVATIADALEEAHRQRIVHRDVKPSNILIDKDRGPRLTDFGIAKHMLAESTASLTGVIGSCYYMSPEQATLSPGAVDPRSDVFSLGVVLYEALTLSRPFTGETIQQVLQSVGRDKPKPLRLYDRTTPRELEIICARALEKRPADRYQSAAHISADLRSWLAGRPILARPLPLWLRAGRWALRNVAVVTIATLTTSVGGLLYAEHVRERSSRSGLSLVGGAAGAEVFVRRHAESSPDPGPRESIGKLPIIDHRLVPGYYRIEIAEENGTRELDVPLFDAGKLETIDLSSRSANLQGFSDMVWVPGGAYTIGLWSPTDSTERQVTVSDFLIDATEVSNEEYKCFVEATGHARPPQWGLFGYDEGLADCPVVGVSWKDMNEFARWSGKRLPTAGEWEVAARFPDGRPLPWGDDPTRLPSRATIEDLRNRNEAAWIPLYESYRALAEPVRAHPDLVSELGLYQMFGGVSEATATLIGPSGGVMVVEGGSYFDEAARWQLGRIATAPAQSVGLSVGFRCARSITLLTTSGE